MFNIIFNMYYNLLKFVDKMEYVFLTTNNEKKKSYTTYFVNEIFSWT